MRNPCIRIGRFAATVLTVGALLYPGPAASNGRFPATVSISARAGSTTELLVGATFGGLVSRDGGGSWRWICEQSMLYSGPVDPVFLWASDGTMFATTWRDLIISRDGGCTWEAHPFFVQRGTTDVVVHPTQPSVVFVTTGRAESENGLYRSLDSGRSFAATSLTRQDVFLSNVRVAASDPSRIYVSGWRLNSQTATLYRSDDGGAMWTEISQSVSDGASFHVLGVSPTDPDVVFTRVAGRPTNTVLRSINGGQSFQSVLKLDEEIRSLTIGPSGTKVWIAGLDSLHRSDDGGATFTKLATPVKNACVGRVGASLYACGWPWEDGWALGRSADDGTSWEKVFTLTDVLGPLECPAGTPTHDLCEQSWPQLAALLGIGTDGGLNPDGGVDGGTPADGGTTSGGGGGCGCAAGGAGGGFLLLAVALVLAVGGRRRRRIPR